MVTNKAITADTNVEIEVIKVVLSGKKVKEVPKPATNPAPTIDTQATIFWFVVI